MTSLLLVNRLRRAYWPSWCARIRLRDVLRAEPVTGYLDEDDRAHLGPWKLRAYDHGRIRYFMDHLDATPIRVDTEWLYGQGAPRPLGPCIDDGHHRYVAAVFLRRRRMPARFCGPVELKAWLVGERRRWPL